MVRSILSQSIPHQISRQETTTPQQTQIQSIQQNGIPPDFDEHVRMLVDQGFDKAKVIEFFQAANYDYDTTYFALVHDRKPEDKPKKKIIPVESEIEMKPEELKVHDEDADVSELDKYDFGPHKKHLDKMTNQEKAGLLDIIKAFPQTEPSVVLQFYVSCEKNFSTTKEIMNKNGLV
ncbi:UBA/TS-N domain containing protein [Histomonas meleagridis]|uniref:UBA/TS-N domain containing protein n=1 Tax=Histomonas meleagridis TaxID=135588 RepID=UPI00355A3BBA|nr:UBA/TS-N domain containing protein [Histomonas meleagridis]KAH0796509.1 UBA/TS-N domain containing protein [Histomonas meleagridis]